MDFLKHSFKLWLIAILFNLIIAFTIEKENDSHQFIEFKQTTKKNEPLVNDSVNLMNEKIQDKNSDDNINDLYPNDDYYYDSLNEDLQNNKNQNLKMHTSTSQNIRENYKQILKDYKEILEFNRQNFKSVNNTINDNESYDYVDANKEDTIEEYFNDLFENPADHSTHQQHESKQQHLQPNEKTNRKEMHKTTQQHPSYRTSESVIGDQINNEHVSTNKKMKFENTNSHKKEIKLVEKSNMLFIIGCLILISLFVLFIAVFVFIFKRNKNSSQKKSHLNKTDIANNCQANYTTVNQNEV